MAVSPGTLSDEGVVRWPDKEADQRRPGDAAVLRITCVAWETCADLKCTG